MTEREFTATLGTPGHARDFALETVRELVGDAAARVVQDDLQLIVSELVTNAVRAGSPTVHLEIATSEPGQLVVRVTDAAQGWPHPRAAANDDPGGRGLALVSAVAASWGARLDDSTKTVWAEITLPA